MEEYIRRYCEKNRTLYELDINDCALIIVNDLMNYEVPDEKIISLLSSYFVPLKQEAGILKKKYGKGEK
ncbi:MAG: hypothetical protein E7394_02770 [Ruminococcaceae bacterium]|nr:hypothetical protein [Oscillospiraceae bacterium]